MKKILTTLILTALVSGCNVVLGDSSSEDSTSIDSTSQPSSPVVTSPLDSTSQTSTSVPLDSSIPEIPADEKWNLVFADEFDYQGEPDQTYWGYETGGGGFGNNELQYYTDRRENSNVDNGVLTITARKESYGNRNYTSAKIVTTNKITWKHGRIDVKAKVPVGRGNWPAIWMMPNTCKEGWPRCGEIDIMEHVGYQPNVIHGTIHTEAYNHMKGTQKGKSINVPTANSDFVVYSFVWSAEEIAWYANDVMYNHYTFDDLYVPNTDPFNLWPLNQQYRLMLNLAIGGDWGGAQGVDNSDSLWPQEFVIDYVRVYEEVYHSNPNTIITPVENLRVPSLGATRASIKWDRPVVENGFDKYNVYIDNQLYTSTEVSSVYLENLTPGKDMKVEVEVVDKLGYVSPKSKIEFTTPGVATINQIIQAEDYIDARGGTLDDCGDTGGGYNIGYISSNDYTVYDVDIPQTQSYLFLVRVATAYSNRRIEVFQDDRSLGIITFGNTGGWQVYQDHVIGVSLNSGRCKIKLVYLTGDININYFMIASAS